jgi:hypothetical protein
MLRIPAQTNKEVIALAVALTLGLGATLANSFVPSAYAWSWHPAHFNLNLHQLLAQINLCVDRGTQCFNSGNNQVNIHLPQGWINHIDLSQALAQENDCSSGSTCINSGSNNADIHVSQHHSFSSTSYFKIDQSIAQQNQCSGGSTCINSGSNNANINIH